MKATNNEIKIIQILLSSNDYISTYEIATLIGISRRSVREEINNVKNILKKRLIFGAKLYETCCSAKCTLRISKGSILFSDESKETNL